MTPYTILRSEKEDGAFQVVGEEQASSAPAAIRAFASKDGGQNGVFVAVPSRSWAPVSVQVEARVRIG